MTDRQFDVHWCRQQFPSLSRTVSGRPAAFFDGPAGTQVTQTVVDAISQYLVECNANHAGQFVTSRETDEWMDRVHAAIADFVGTTDPQTIAFGPNMTTLTFAMSRALARDWKLGDEIVVTRLEHDANFTPWVMAARDAGATVRYVDIHPEDCTLDLEDLQSKLNERTRLIAVGCASNATGTRNPVAQICQWAHQIGALTFLDAVHLAPHDLLDVQQIDCDFLVCSAYKFFGPHQGVLWGRRELLESIDPYKLRPSPDDLPGRWMTGTQNHECLAGTLAAVEYLASVGCHHRDDLATTRRVQLRNAFERIAAYERELVMRLIDGLSQIPQLKIWGIVDPNQFDRRLPTIAFTHPRMSPYEIAKALGNQAFFVWHGNYYALPLTERLGLEPDGMVRVGIVHYNTATEIDELIDATSRLLS